MASGLMRSAISSVLEEKAVKVGSARVDGLVGLGNSILSKITSGEAKMCAFDQFSEKLTTVLRSSVDPSKVYRSSAVKREKLWVAFHQLRMTHLPQLWSEFLISIGVQADDHLLQQSVNQKVFEMILPEHFTTQCSECQPQSIGDSPLSQDELNALEYACGYIPHTLLKRYERRTDRNYDKFIECLGDMAVKGDHDDILDYTREWIEKVNRGGLFPLNNITFLFFVAIERQVRVLLPRHVLKPSESSECFKEEVVDKISQNDDVQWHWTLISQTIDSEDDAVELLKEIVKLWVTVRGFSLAATWMEVYKQETKTTTKKTTALRKELSRKTPDEG